MRLDKYVSGSSALSRKDAAKAIRSGRVLVNSEKARNSSQHIDVDNALITLDDETLLYREHIYIMLNKPIDYICSTKDASNKIILELLPEIFAQREPFACGRLDIDTTGLVLLTDDGSWSHNITSPKKKCFKTYIITSLADLSEEAMQNLENGVMLDGDDKITLPATIKELASCEYELQIQEGRFHQVKRMFEAVGHKVIKLHRKSIGSIALDSQLESGTWRELTNDEIKHFKK